MTRVTPWQTLAVALLVVNTYVVTSCSTNAAQACAASPTGTFAFFEAGPSLYGVAVCNAGQALACRCVVLCLFNVAALIG